MFTFYFYFVRFKRNNIFSYTDLFTEFFINLMYRRHLRMTLLKDMEANKSRSEFLQRVASIPVVYLAWNIATETYNNLKSSNKFFKISFSTSEKAAAFISKPVLKRIEKPLKLADNLACKGLDTIQGVVPAVRNQQEKLYRQTISFYNEALENGLKKYAVVRNLSSVKLIQFINAGTAKFEELCASPYGEVCDLVLDIVFGAGEIYVDYYLPPLGDERPDKVFGDRGKEPKWQRADLLRNRIKERLYKHTLLQIQRIRLQTKILIAKIYTFNFYEYMVQVSSTLPNTTYTVVVHLFSSIEDVISYLVSLIIEQNENNGEV